jgi:BarA-like signal transduction histidine kinase
MQPHRSKLSTGSKLLLSLPHTQSVEADIRQLSASVRVLLELLNVCRLADQAIAEPTEHQQPHLQEQGEP